MASHGYNENDDFEEDQEMAKVSLTMFNHKDHPLQRQRFKTNLNKLIILLQHQALDMGLSLSLMIQFMSKSWQHDMKKKKKKNKEHLSKEEELVEEVRTYVSQQQSWIDKPTEIDILSW